MTVTWPADINDLAERGSWQMSPRMDGLRTDFDVGPARTRRRFTQSFTEFQFSVVMDGDEFERFKSFVAFDLRQATRWFQSSVFIGSGYVVQTVRFMDQKKPYSVAERGFGSVVVSMALEARGPAMAYSDGASWLIAQYGLELSGTLMDILQQVVNVDYPDAVGTS